MTEIETRLDSLIQFRETVAQKALGDDEQSQRVWRELEHKIVQEIKNIREKLNYLHNFPKKHA